MELKSTENLKDVERFAASFVRGAYKKYEKPGSEVLRAIVEGTAGVLSGSSKFFPFTTKPAADASKTFYKYWDAKKTNLFQQKVKTIITFESDETFYEQFKKTVVPLAVQVYYVFEHQLEKNIFLDTTTDGDQAQAVQLLAAYARNKCLEYMVEHESVERALEVLTLKSKLLQATSYCRLEKYAEGKTLYFYENKETKNKIQISSYEFFQKAIPVFVVNKEIIHWDNLRTHKDIKNPMGARLRRLFTFKNHPKEESSFIQLPESVKTTVLLPNYFWAETNSDQAVNAILPKICRKVALNTTDEHCMRTTSSHELKTQVNQVLDIVKELKATSTNQEAAIPKLSFAQFDEPADFLTERRNIVDRIHERLKHCSTNSSLLHRIVVLHGMAGIGKSELARMYARTYLKDKIIQNVAWINAESETSLTTSFTVLANTLKLANDPRNIKATVASIYEHFSENIGTGLFIFDNAPQMKKTRREFGIYEFLPTQFYKQRPLVLITSRNNVWQRIPAESKIEVEELCNDEAIEFIKNGLELTNKQRGDEKVNFAIRSLAENLQGYTLALVLATSNIQNKTWGEGIVSSIEKYVQRMNNPKGRWPHDKHSTGTATNYDLIMSNVWSATFSQIASLNNEGEDALKLLNFMAFLPTDGITVEKISDIFSFSYKKRFDEQSVALLENYSLIKVIPDTDWNCNRIRIHRLVQHCARDKLDCEKDCSSLFQICNYLTGQKENDYDFEEIKSCMHEHLKQRNWPGDSIKYPVIFCSLSIWYAREFHSNGEKYIPDAKSFLDSQNPNTSEIASLKNMFELLYLCLAFYFTTSQYNSHEAFKNPTLKTKLKEVVLLYEKDYVRYLSEGCVHNFQKSEIKPDLVTEPCYRVCHKILTENAALVKSEFQIEFRIFENLVAHLNSSEKIRQDIVAVNKVYDLLWSHSSNACPVSVVHVVKCVVKQHRLLQVQLKLLSVTNRETQVYWSNGGPFLYYIILWRMHNADWSRAFVDAFFDEGGPQVIAHHLTFLSSSDDHKGFQSAFINLTEFINKLGLGCSGKFIRDADFMESLLLCSKHVFSPQNKNLSDFKEKCIVPWFTLFRHNETVNDCRGRSWSINDVTNEMSLLLTSHDLDNAIRYWFCSYVHVFETFLEAPKDEPESVAMKLAKATVKRNTKKTLKTRLGWATAP